MAKLESLVVDLQLNAAQLQKGLDEANSKLGAFDQQLKSLAGVVVFEKFAKMAATAVGSLAGFALKGAESADHMGKMAQAAGTTVEGFSRLAYAGELSGVGVDALGAALVKLDGNMSKAVSGGKEQAATFAALGVKLTDSTGKLRGAEAVMGDLAERFAGMADGAAKTKLAVDVFGKSGADMIPMLNAGRDGLAALSAEADKFGITVSAGAAASAEAFNDNLAKLQLAVNAVGQRVAAQLTPALTALTDELLNSTEGTEFLNDAAFILSGTLKVLASGGVIISAVFEAVGKTLARVASAVLNAAQGNFSAAFDDLVGQFTDIGEAAAGAAKRVETIWTAGDAPAKAVRQSFTRNAEAIVANAEALKKAATEAESAFKSLEKVALGFEAQVAGFGADEFEQLKSKLEKGELAEQLAKLGDEAAEMRDRILEAAGALRDLKDAKLANEISFNRTRDSAQLGRQVEDRRTQFSQVGMTDIERAAAATRSFANFDEALGTLARQTDEHSRLLGVAQWQQAHGATESAQASMLAADEHKRAAELAGRAADAFEELAKQNIERQKAIANMAISVISSIGESGAEVGKLVQSAMQGFSAGGIWGAIIAVIANLFAKLEAVGEFMDTAFGNFMDAFSQLNDSFSILFESLTSSLVPVMKALAIAFKAFNDILVPVFETLEQIRAPFAALAEGFLGLLESTGILGFVVKLVSGVFRVVGLVISTIVLGIQYLWGALLKVVREVISFFTAGRGTKEIDKTIKDHDDSIEATKAAMARSAESIGKDREAPGSAAMGPNGGAGGSATGPVDLTFEQVWARNEERARQIEAARYAAYSDAIAAGLGFEAASEAGRRAIEEWTAANPIEPIAEHVDGLGTAAEEAAKTLNSFSQSLTNVPAGFRYAAAAFNAQDIGGTAPASASAQGGGDTFNVTVQGSLLTELDLAAIVENMQRRKNFRKTGAGG